MVIYVALYTQCLRYNICRAWFLDIRISTCLNFEIDTHNIAIKLQNIPKFNIRASIIQNFPRGHASRYSSIAMLAMHAD